MKPKIYKSKHKQWSLLLGRFQCLPPHRGHQELVKTLLKENKNVLIALRKEDGSDKNPYSIRQRKKAFKKIFENEIKQGKIKIIGIEDVIEVVCGRKPGWKIRKINLSKNLEKISATKIREKCLKKH
jgi:FAD synthase